MGPPEPCELAAKKIAFGAAWDVIAGGGIEMVSS